MSTATAPESPSSSPDPQDPVTRDAWQDSDALHRWLALQDSCRRRAQALNSRRFCIHLVSFFLGLLLPFVPWFGALLTEYVPSLESSHLSGGLALAIVLVELLAAFIHARSEKLHVASRNALAVALPAAAFARSPPAALFLDVMEQTAGEIRKANIDACLHDPKTVERFKTWWATKRPAGEGRLRAMLLENALWTSAILEAARVTKNQWRIGLLVLLIVALLLGALMAPQGTRTFSENLVLPVLAFLIALNGAGVLESSDDHARALQHVLVQLRGSDAVCRQNDAVAWSLFGIYLNVTAAAPPISSTIYDAQHDRLAELTTNEALEATLDPR